MKQMTLFESFKKKGSQTNSPSQVPMSAQTKPKNPENVVSQPRQIQNKNTTPHTSTKKRKSKLNMDSDEEQFEAQSQENIQVAQYQVDEEKSTKNKKAAKNSKKKLIEESNQMVDESHQQKKPQKQNNGKKQKLGQNLSSKNKAKQQEDDPLSHFSDATPKWAQKQHCKDSQKRSPNHPDYDPTTLYIPESQWANFSAPMKQFWRIKSQNFDKIILFKLGKFYELFYDDAAIGNKYLDLKFMGTKMHTGFPQKSLQRYSDQLVRLGFKTVIVQQMQTPQQMNERVKKQKSMGKKPEKTISREVTQILTKGTMPPRDQTNEIYLPNYLMSVRIHHNEFSFALLQISTNQIAMGIVQGFQNFKTVLYQTRPSEVVYDPDNIPNDVCSIMQKSFLQIQMSKLINKKNIWHPLTAVCQIQRLLKQGNIKKPKIFQKIDSMPDTGKNLLYSALSGMFDYLKCVFRFDYVIGTARFTFYQKNKHCHSMVLDSQALQHLQIFETSDGSPGCLFQCIDRTKTKFGKRLLRRWLMSPLISITHLNERLNAIQDLQDNLVQRAKLAQVLKKLPDLQKKANKLYHYSIKNTNASKAVYFQNIHENRLKQFKQFIQKLENAWQGILKLNKISHVFKSKRLKSLVNVSKSQQKIQDNNDYYNQQDVQEQEENGILPNIMSHLEEFGNYIKWQGGTPVPQKGLVSFYDQLQDQIEGIKKKLQKYIQELRYELKQPNLNFVHTKQRYQIEIPQKSEKRRPKDFQFSSKKSGYSRYITPKTKEMVKQLEKAQQNVKQQLGLFVAFFFEEFKKKHHIWQKFIQILAELDCYISLSQYSFLSQKVRPTFTSQSKFSIKEARHPCLTSIDFIPNDIVLDRKIMLLTGPNMGGKSTLLRTSCILAVLSQIGCYVPASQYTCSPVDRIFTRIGASDKLQLGKSTFFIEMQQTKNIIIHGTERSLAIVDQLGRGTSTFDGLAIAYSVLKDVSERIKCYCLFATHYHVLLEQFKTHPQISLKKMDCIVKQAKQQNSTNNNGHSHGHKQGQIIFLYKLVQGNVDRSFGISIARKVGLSKSMIEMALDKAEQMNNFLESKKRKILQKALEFINCEDE